MTVTPFPPGGGRHELPRPVECRLIVEQVAGECARALGRTVPLTVGPLPRFTTRPALLRDVLSSLMEEALAAGKDAGVEVGCRLTEGHARFFVTPFSREMPACVPRVREAVEKEGGRIWVERAAGGGATAWFSLPGDPVPA
jgi:hypothetical protein